MQALSEWIASLPGVRVATVVLFAAVGAVLPRDLALGARLMTFCIGVLAAIVFGEAVREALSLPSSWSNGIAGILAMTGRNIAVYVIRASKDPAAAAREALEIVRGRSPK